MPRAVVALLAALVLGSCGTAETPAAKPRPASPSAPASPGRPPLGAPVAVLLIHGYGGSSAEMNLLSGRLRANGQQPVVVQLPGGGRGDIDASAAVVDSVVRGLPRGPIDLVGFSLGGVIARAWVRRYGADRARVVVTLGSPHHGVRLAGAVRDSGAACPAACQQLIPGSALLTRLNQGDPTPGGARWVSVRTDDDEVVEGESTRLEGALGLRLQAVCPGRRIGHGALVRDALAVGVVVRALQGRLPGAPPPAQCAAVVQEGSA